MVLVLMGSVPPSCSKMFFFAFFLRLVLRSASCCHFCYQSLQFLLHHLRNLGNLLALVLGKQRDEAVIGHEGPAFFVLVDDQLQWSIQASFWHVPGHLSSKERIANGILGGPARFSYQGEEEAVFHLKKESQSACSNMRFNRLGELLPGRVSGSRLLPNCRPILRRAEPSLQRANNLFIGLVRLNDNVLNSDRSRVSHVETPSCSFLIRRLARFLLRVKVLLSISRVQPRSLLPG